MGDSLANTLQQGISFHQSGQLDEAIRCYREALKGQPENISVLSNLGVALRARGMLDEAAACFRKVLAINPGNADAHYNLGNALKGQGQLDEAISCYRTAISIKPEFARFHYNLGNTLQGQGRLDEAVSCYRKAIVINPDDARVHYNLGKALKDQDKLDAAVSSYRKAIAINPEFAEAHQNLGNALKDQGKPDQTVECCRSVVAIRPENAVAHYNLGIALRDLGKRDEAISSFKEALELKPDFAEARHLIDSLLGRATKSPPRKYIENLFNHRAEAFEIQLVMQLGYKMPSILKKVAVERGLADEKFGNVIDLGCGTGLAGVAFRDLAESLIGIDLSENMIREAQKKNTYDELYVNDIIEGLESLDTKFNLFVSADVLVYLGDLLPLFRSVKKHSADHALMIFSTEHTDADGYMLQETGRYAHSKDYIHSVATAAGLHLDYYTQAKLRKEKGVWILGGIYVLRSVNPLD